jgi:predicted RNA-binding Zn ribbon-like protein
VGSGQEPPHLFELTGGEVCLDFANTVDDRSDAERRRDYLRSYRDLISWGKQADILSQAETDRLLRAADRRPDVARRMLTRALRLREAVYEAFSARAAGRTVPAPSLATISSEARLAASHRGISPDNGEFRWAWDATGEHLDRPLWPVALSAADVLTSPRVSLVRECASETCGWLFLDTSRNRTRRWCDMRACGNRAKARRFYARARGRR